MVAASDVAGGTYCPRGLDVAELEGWVDAGHRLADFPGGEAVTNPELLELSCDILVPAAIQNQITEHNADDLECRLVVEGANGPTTLEADAILEERGIRVVPDILANAGGVTVSYFEWVQGVAQFFWSEEEVNRRLDRLMSRAFRQVADAAKERGSSWRTAALIRGLERVNTAKRHRGVFP